MTENIRPHIYALEGLDGSGKTSHLSRLADDLEALGLRVTTASSPARTWTGSTLRAHIGDIPTDKQNRLFTYDIVRTQREIPNYTDVVIWDRHLDSIVVSNKEGSQAEVSAGADKISKPNKVIYLDITPEVSWDREGAVSDHPIDQEWISDKYRRYQQLLKDYPSRFEIIDATKPLDEVYSALWHWFIRELDPLIEKNKALYDLLFDTPGIVRFLIENPAEVKPGVFLPMFMNFKSTWSLPQERSILTHALIEDMGKSYDWVVGMESGGSYYATSVANEMNVPVTLLRKCDKSHGDKDMWVGRVPEKGATVAIIDDVYATGQSGKRATEKILEIGCLPSLHTIFSYSSDNEMKSRIGTDATSLAYFKALRANALDRGLISLEQAKLLTQQVDVYRNTTYA